MFSHVFYAGFYCAFYAKKYSVIFRAANKVVWIFYRTFIQVVTNFVPFLNI